MTVTKNVQDYVYRTLFARMALAVLFVLQSAVLTRILGPTGRGLFSKLQASLSFFILLLGLGVTSTIVYYFSNRKISPAKVLGASIFVTFGGITILCAGLLVAHFYPALDFIFPVDFRGSFFVWYLFISFAATQFQLLASAMLRSRAHYNAHNRLEIWNGLIRLVVLFGFYLLVYPVPLKWIFAVDLAALLIKTVWFWTAYRRLVGELVDFRLSWESEIHPMIKFTALLYVSFLINFVYTRVDVWIVESREGLAQLGVYSVAYGLVQILTFMPVTLNSVLFPHVSGLSPEEGLKSLSFFSRLNFSVLVFAGTILTVFARPLVLFFYGVEFEGAVLPMQVLIWATVMMSIKYLFTYFNAAQGRVRDNFYCELIALVLGVGLNFKLVALWGILGASVASMVSNGISCTFIIIRALRNHDVKWKDFTWMRPSDVGTMLRSGVWPLPFEPAKYILRLDDACSTCRRQTWEKLEQMLDRYGMKPIVGVIPQNVDSALMIDPPDPNFWNRVREWQAKGWIIAMHGFQHDLKRVHIHDNLVPIQPMSEFSTFPKEDQREKIRKAWNIFLQEGVRPKMWMAPAHSFDRTTLAVLEEETDIRVITDGLGVYPYKQYGFTWLPQQVWFLKARPFGVWTTCLHPNSMDDEDLEELEVQLVRMTPYVLSNYNQLLSDFSQRTRGLIDRVFLRYFLWRTWTLNFSARIKMRVLRP